MTKRNASSAHLRRTGTVRQAANLLRRTPYIRLSGGLYVGAALVGGLLGLGLGQSPIWALFGVALSPLMLWLATFGGGLRSGRWRLVGADLLGIFGKHRGPTRQIKAIAAIARSRDFAIYGLASGIAAQRSFAGFSWTPSLGLGGITLRYIDLEDRPGTKIEVETVALERRRQPSAGPGPGRIADRGVSIVERHDVAATIDVGGEDMDVSVFGDLTNWSAHGANGARELFIRAEGVAIASLRLVVVTDLSGYLS